MLSTIISWYGRNLLKISISGFNCTSWYSARKRSYRSTKKWFMLGGCRRLLDCSDSLLLSVLHVPGMIPTPITKRAHIYYRSLLSFTLFVYVRNKYESISRLKLKLFYLYFCIVSLALIERWFKFKIVPTVEKKN